MGLGIVPSAHRREDVQMMKDETGQPENVRDVLKANLPFAGLCAASRTVAAQS
jgi:hypothetical protein